MNVGKGANSSGGQIFRGSKGGGSYELEIRFSKTAWAASEGRDYTFRLAPWYTIRVSDS